MNAPKINSTLFVTLLSACLCVLAAGAPVHARQATTRASQAVVSQVYLKLGAASSSTLKLKLDRRQLSASAIAAESLAQESLYQNVEAHAEIERVLVVTRLARASLSSLSAK